MNNNKIRYDNKLLQECILRDNAKLEEEYEQLNRDKIIKFSCSCGEEGCNKSFKSIYKEGRAYCKECSSKNKFEKIKQTMVNIYGVEYPLQSKDIRKKVKQTIFKNYGVNNPGQSKEIRQKMKETNIKKYGVEEPLSSSIIREKIQITTKEKYGVDNTINSSEIKNKIKETMIKRYGVEYTAQSYILREKMKKTNIEKHGVEYPIQSSIIKEKMKKTNIEKYGVEHPSQIPGFSEKQVINSYKRKEVITPSGKVLYMQGYEPHAYKILLYTYTEEEILNSRIDVPEIWWSDKEGKRHRYYVDFYIPKDNLMIEIKSERTLIIGKEKIEKTLQASKESGYNIELWVINNKGEIINKF